LVLEKRKTNDVAESRLRGVRDAFHFSEKAPGREVRAIPDSV
jgi:hypothetical protein